MSFLEENLESRPLLLNAEFSSFYLSQAKRKMTSLNIIICEERRLIIVVLWSDRTKYYLSLTFRGRAQGGLEVIQICHLCVPMRSVSALIEWPVSVTKCVSVSGWGWGAPDHKFQREDYSRHREPCRCGLINGRNMLLEWTLVCPS